MRTIKANYLLFILSAVAFSHRSGIWRIWRLEPCSVRGSPRWNVCIRGEEVSHQWNIGLFSQVHDGA